MNLEEKIQQAGNVADMLRNVPQGPYVYPMRAEYTNWRDEQRAWHATAVLFDQSHHMTDIYFKGPDALRLMSDLGVNGFRNFGRNKAKQFVACNHDGYFVGDAILFGFEDDEFSLVGRPVAPNWVAFQAETGQYRVTVTRDERSIANDGRRLTFRFQLNGPATHRIVEKAAGAPLPRIRFFGMGEIEIAGVPIRALNHTMVGIPGQEFTGLELIGPSEHGERVLDALLVAGEDFGLRQGGARAYPSTAIESGWIPAPVPALYTGASMKPFREWLSAEGFEANASIGGSFVSQDIEDYYVTPWDLGYGRVIKFDHDFVGRAALERMADQPHRRKVWLRWSDRDTADLVADSLFGTGPRAKYLEMPVSHYATGTYDKVLVDGRLVGVSANNGYTVNVGGWSSLGMVDEAEATDGREVEIVIGEENGGSAKPTVEPHVQRYIRATLHTRPLV
ncbi:syringate O-demethylase/vanillate/3-O-methylgallate O-demethylase [Streptomyces sp. 840.1]|uniref:aminomethyltransferase family protein n=1 Tax=Streptomyces sp. 840.1 TaxID=2485152 RepID=UPI000F4A78E1|nr:aminomethyltransferase family protein [Streptomyces sp. 840.1]ROQ60123.1 syringate O-demethylase/vanillate/3-O-methylgallate O-demethylase [Streptomyces sp. 840.1]